MRQIIHPYYSPECESLQNYNVFPGHKIWNQAVILKIHNLIYKLNRRTPKMYKSAFTLRDALRTESHTDIKAYSEK